MTNFQSVGRKTLTELPSSCKTKKPTSTGRAFKRGLAMAMMLAVFACPAATREMDLHWAVETGDAQKSEELLEEGADPNALDTSSDFKLTPLHKAAMLRNVPIMRLLLEHGAKPNAKSLDGKTPLHKTVVSSLWPDELINAQEAAVRLLLEHGADPCIKSKNYRTPLHEAVDKFDARAVFLLMEYGGSECVHSGDYTGSSPIEYMERWKHLPVAKRFFVS